MPREVQETRVVARTPSQPVRNGAPTEDVGRPDDDRRRRGGIGWIWPLLALLLLALLALLLYFNLRGGGEDTAPSGANATQSEQQGGGSGGSAAAGAGTLTAGGDSLLPAPSAGMLSGMVGEAVTGTAVPVQAVVSDEAFWVGASAQDRMFVRLERGSESPFQVRAGENVSFRGTLTQVDAGLAEELGVTEAEGASLLAQQGTYIDVQSGTLADG